MNDHDDAHDIYHWMKLGLGLCIAGALLILGLLTLGRAGSSQGDEVAEPLQVAARSAVHAAMASASASVSASASPLAPGVTARPSYHDAPFVTDAGGGEPGPMQQ